MIEQFFKAFDIPPLVKKGETYFTSNFRFAEVVADMDMYATITIETLEDIIIKKYGTMKISGDINYVYTIEQLPFTEPKETRLDALLSFFILNKDIFYNDIRELYSDCLSARKV